MRVFSMINCTIGVFLSVVLLSLIGCGSASNNDQGISFTMLGYSVAATTTSTTGCSTTPNLSGGVFALGSTAESEGSTNVVFGGVVVKNNLTTQFVRPQSLALEFLIPGASIIPPTTTVPYGGVVAKAGGLLCGTVALVPPQILSWMNLNRNSLPELPFLLIVRGQVTGTTSSGDVLTTNPVDIGFTVTEDNVIPPAEVTPDGTTASASDVTTQDSDTADQLGDDTSDGSQI